MSLPYRLALAGATLMSAVALYDAVHVGVTGRPSGFSDEYGITAMMVVGGLVHGLGYAALLVLLVADRERIDAGNAVRRWTRRLLIVDLGVMASMFCVGTWFLPAMERAGWGGATSAVGGIAFLVMFVLSFALGAVLVRRRELRPGAVVLLGIVPTIGLAIGLGALGSDFAHPAYPEVAVYLGLALLGHRAATRTAGVASAPVRASAVS